MNLTSPSQVRALLSELDISPQKGLGQNFLIDVNIRDIIIRSACLTNTDRALEIGPGLGVLTEEIVGKAGHLTAVEKDRGLAGHLRNRFANTPELQLLEKDVRDMDLESLAMNKVVSNLPYSCGTRVLVDIARMQTPPELIVVTLQDEVVERIVAVPGTADYGMLSTWLQLNYEPERIHQVGERCFWPVPEVKSAIVRLKLRPGSRLSATETDFFYRLTKYAFSQRRKQMASILSRAPGNLGMPRDQAESLLEKVGLSTEVRPGAIAVGKWCELVRECKPAKEGRCE